MKLDDNKLEEMKVSLTTVSTYSNEINWMGHPDLACQTSPPPNKNIAPPPQTKWSQLAHLGLGLCFLLDLSIKKWFQSVHFTNKKIRFQKFWLKLQPKLAPQNQKSWLRLCIQCVYAPSSFSAHLE